MTAAKAEQMIQAAHTAGQIARRTSVRGHYANLYVLADATFPQVLVRVLGPLANGSLTAARRAFRCGFDGQ